MVCLVEVNDQVNNIVIMIIIIMPILQYNTNEMVTKEKGK